MTREFHCAGRENHTEVAIMAETREIRFTVTGMT